MTVKVLLDTDIGSDIDDAQALEWLLRQPESELLGITTVSGQALELSGDLHARSRFDAQHPLSVLSGRRVSSATATVGLDLEQALGDCVMRLEREIVKCCGPK